MRAENAKNFPDIVRRTLDDSGSTASGAVKRKNNLAPVMDGAIDYNKYTDVYICAITI